MAADMAAVNAASMAGIAEAKPAEMAAVNAASIAWIAKEKSVRMTAVNDVSMAWLYMPRCGLLCDNGTLI